jgi:hypothetical protein
MGDGMELGVPPASSAIANGVFDDIATAVGSAVAVGGAAASEPPTGAWGPDGAASAVAVRTWGPDGTASVVADGTWGADGAASTVAGGGRSPASRPADACCWEPDSLVGATLEVEGEVALISKGWVNARQHGN